MTLKVMTTTDKHLVCVLQMDGRLVAPRDVAAVWGDATGIVLKAVMILLVFHAPQCIALCKQTGRHVQAQHGIVPWSRGRAHHSLRSLKYFD